MWNEILEHAPRFYKYTITNNFTFICYSSQLIFNSYSGNIKGKIDIKQSIVSLFNSNLIIQTDNFNCFDFD